MKKYSYNSINEQDNEETGKNCKMLYDELNENTSTNAICKDLNLRK